VALEKKGNNRSNILKAGLVAAQMLSPLGHAKIEAAEIPRTATWEQGALELNRSAKEEPVEYGATFLFYTNGTNDWLPTNAGDAARTDSNIYLHKDSIEIYSRNKKIAYACNIHTHPPDIVRETTRPAKLPFIPPSKQDISAAYYMNKIPGMHVGVQSLSFAVFDPQGIWYYRALNDVELREKPSLWYKIERRRELEKDFLARERIVLDIVYSLDDKTTLKAAEYLPAKVRTSIEPQNRGHPGVLGTYIKEHLIGMDKENLSKEILNLMPSGKQGELDRIHAVGSELRSLQDFFNGRASAVDGIAYNIRKNSAAMDDFDFETVYPVLQKIYEEDLLAKIRFVPITSLHKEPACAGPDYKPKERE